MSTIKVQERGVITLPKKVRVRLNIKSGTILNIKEAPEGIIISRQNPQTERDEVMEDVRQSLEDFKSGNYIEFSTIKEFNKKRKEKWGKA